MEGSLSDVIKNQVIPGGVGLITPRGMMSFVTMIDLIIIVPSIVAFLAINLRILSAHGIFIAVLTSVFLLYLPLAILSGGVFFTRKHDLSHTPDSGEKVVPIILFFIFLFSLLGIYIPTVGRISQLFPEFGSLNVMGGLLVLINCFLVWKVASRMIKN